jgi:chemotaxis protein methyltransferase CheR
VQYHADSLGITGSVTSILRDLIHEKLGLSYEPHQFDMVADRLSPLVVAKGFSSFIDYYYLLKYSDAGDEWLKVMDALSVQETYFWREIDQLRAVVTHVVPELVTRLAGKPLRIWSMPCASGEEPLTIAMLLEEAGWFDRVPIELRGSDASQAAIARARAGRYTQRSFRNLPAYLRDKYFAAGDKDWTVSPSLHQRVTYDVVNLMVESEVARHAASPIIFCRNVFIYFSDQSIRRALGVFERMMPSPGYLCVSASESLLRRTTVFELEEIGDAFMYVKHTPPGATGTASPERSQGAAPRTAIEQAS